MQVFTYQTSGGKDLIYDYLDQLPRDEAKYGYTILEELEKAGLAALDVVETRKLRGKIIEVKFGQNRFIYVAEANSIYILHACRKQKNKTEQKDMEIAIKRAKELGQEIGMRFV